MIKLMDLLNEESFVAKSTKSGKMVNFGSKETRDAAIKRMIQNSPGVRQT